MRRFAVAVMAVIVSAVFSAMSAGLDFPKSEWKITNQGASGGVLKKSPDGKFYFYGSKAYDATTGKPAFTLSFGGFRIFDVDWDKLGNLWLATENGLRRLSKTDTALYTVKSSGLASNFIVVVKYDPANNRIIASCAKTVVNQSDSGGLSIINLDSLCKPASFKNTLRGQGTDAIGIYKQEIWAVGYANVFHCDSSQQDSLHWVVDSGFYTPSYSAFVTDSGDVYLGVADSFHAVISPTEMYSGWHIAKFSRKTLVWERIDLGPAYNKDDIAQLVVDKKEALWFASESRLSKLDLISGKIDSIGYGAGIAWLDDGGYPGTWHPSLGLTFDGHIIIGGKGAFVENIDPVAIKNQFAIAPRLIGQKSRTSLFPEAVEFFSLDGRKAATPFYSGRFLESRSSSGLNLTIIRTPQGYKAKKTLIAK